MQEINEEQASLERFAAFYERSQEPVMQAIERRVCGCDYGGNSWTTRAEADKLIDLLKLCEGMRVLDIGAGSGWPGLYLSKKTGCEIVLVDLPEIGLRIAEERAVQDGQSRLVQTMVADAAELPFADKSFDAVTHSDLLCCLVRKRDVLMRCRAVIRPGGLMAFTVISIAPGLSDRQLERAIANGPVFVESDYSYEALISDAGWNIISALDLTADYARSCCRQLDADLASQDDLIALIGSQLFEDRIKMWRGKVSAIEDGLYRRELFLVEPHESKTS